MAYELWDSRSRNIVGDYATEQHALAIVRDGARIDDQEAAESLALTDVRSCERSDHRHRDRRRTGCSGSQRTG